MRKRVLDMLIDPDGNGSVLEAYAIELDRQGNLFRNLGDINILRDDDIVTGLLVNRETGNLYPIQYSVVSLLKCDDMDMPSTKRFLDEIRTQVPASISELFGPFIEILTWRFNERSEHSNWCRDEMRYYDQDVDNTEKRERMVASIREQDLWHIFLERKHNLLDELRKDYIGPGNTVMELGCGNARTIFRLLNPGSLGFNYIGIDISSQRLRVAKRVVPSGDFIQCSALNLPFKDEIVDYILAFGVLHHLQDPVGGLAEAYRKLKQNGKFMIHEPIAKTKSILENRKLVFLKKYFEEYEHSEHDNELNMKSVDAYIAAQGVDLFSVSYSVTVFRTIFTKILNIFSVTRHNYLMWKIMIVIDNLFKKIFCSKPNFLGPNAVFMILRKQ